MSNSKMNILKVLWISSIPPYPSISGNRRHLNQTIDRIKKYYLNCSIDFVQYGWKKEFDDNSWFYKKNFNRFLFINKPDEQNLSKSTDTCWGVDDWVSQECIDSVGNFINNEDYNIVFVEYVWMSKLLDLFDDRVVKIINTHDIFSNRDEIFLKSGLNKQWFYTSIQEEKKGIERADIVLAITESDKIFFEDMLMNSSSQVEVLYFGSGVNKKNISSFVAENFENRELVVGYIASSNALNKKSIEIFFDTLNDMNLKNIKCHFNIAGSVSSYIKKYDNIKIYKKGVVNDLAEFYAKSDIIITPMIEGTGLKIKCLEAIEYHKPFAGTKFSTNDLSVDTVWHQFNSIEEFAKYFGVWLSNTAESPIKRSRTLNYLKMKTEELYNDLTEKNDALLSLFYKTINDILLKKRTKDEHAKRINKQNVVNDCKVSVIIPVFNTEKYLPRCLDSILNDKLDDFEIIIIDDGSTDSSLKILRDYQKKYSDKIKLYEQENRGQAIARNNGLKVARGEYVYFVDSDDYLGKDSLDLLYNFSKIHKLDICSPDRPYLNQRPLSYISALPGWCCFVKRSVFDNDKYAIRQPAIRSGQDGVFANMILTQCEKAGVCSDAKYYYEKRSDSTFNLVSKDVSIVPHLVESHLDVLKSFYSKYNLYENQATRYLLFVQDESYALRFKKNAKILSKYDGKWLYLIIKNEIINWLEKLDNNDLKYFSKEFIDISKLTYEQFMEKYIHG